MQHEIVILLAHLLFEQNKQVTYDKFIPTIMMKFYQAELIAKTFLKQWGSGEIDSILAEHFLFNRERNDRLRTLSKPFLEFIEKEDEESESENESDDSKNSGSNESSESESEEDN